jgi:hypothetical protein
MLILIHISANRGSNEAFNADTAKSMGRNDRQTLVWYALTMCSNRFCAFSFGIGMACDDRTSLMYGANSVQRWRELLCFWWGS